MLNSPQGGAEGVLLCERENSLKDVSRHFSLNNQKVELSTNVQERLEVDFILEGKIS